MRRHTTPVRAVLAAASLASALASDAGVLDKLKLDSANLAIRVNVKAMREAPIYKDIDALSKGEAAPLPPEAKENTPEKLCEELGLKFEDIGEMAGLLRLPPSAFDPATPSNVDDLVFLFAAELAKPLSVDDIAKAINLAAAERKSGVEAAVFEEGGMKFARATWPPDRAGELDELCMTVGEAGKLFLAGTRAELVGFATGKGKAAKDAGLGKALANVSKDAQLAIALLNPDAGRPKNPKAKDNNPMAALEEFTSASLEAVFKDSLAVKAVISLPKSADAVALARQLNTEMAQAKMMMMLMAGGQPLSVIQTLAARSIPGESAVEIGCSMTKADVEVFKTIAANMANMAASGGIPPGMMVQGNDDDGGGDGGEDDGEDGGGEDGGGGGAGRPAPAAPKFKPAPSPAN